MKKERLQEIYNFLEESEHIHPGNVIDSELLSVLFSVNDIDSLEYIGPLILLIKKIEEHGLFAKAVDGNIRIFTADESPEVAKKRQKKAQRIQQNTFETLKQIDISSISDKDDRDKALHQLNLLGMLNRSSRLIIEQTRIYEKD